jgi:hypothetical protein
MDRSEQHWDSRIGRRLKLRDLGLFVEHVRAVAKTMFAASNPTSSVRCKTNGRYVAA